MEPHDSYFLLFWELTFIHLVHNHILCTYYVLETELDTGETKVSQIVLTFRQLPVVDGESQQKRAILILYRGRFIYAWSWKNGVVDGYMEGSEKTLKGADSSTKV